jgi:NAD(P)H-dependent flavin oxidoreductase YrpB (nitropropane dioxygenase family)
MSDSISKAGPERSAPGHAVGATAAQWPEKKPIWPDRRLIDLLGIEHPLVLAPMAGLGTVELAAAVCAGGGLGSLGCVGLQPELVIKAVDKLRTLTGKPINTNFFCHNAARAAVCFVVGTSPHREPRFARTARARAAPRRIHG